MDDPPTRYISFIQSISKEIKRVMDPSHIPSKGDKVILHNIVYSVDNVCYEYRSNDTYIKVYVSEL